VVLHQQWTGEVDGGDERGPEYHQLVLGLHIHVVKKMNQADLDVLVRLRNSRDNGADIYG
jgi:hypothetical protein